jgi:hypothetical protein
VGPSCRPLCRHPSRLHWLNGAALPYLAHAGIKGASSDRRCPNASPSSILGLVGAPSAPSSRCSALPHAAEPWPPSGAAHPTGTQSCCVTPTVSQLCASVTRANSSRSPELQRGRRSPRRAPLKAAARSLPCPTVRHGAATSEQSPSSSPVAGASAEHVRQPAGHR